MVSPFFQRLCTTPSPSSIVQSHLYSLPFPANPRPLPLGLLLLRKIRRLHIPRHARQLHRQPIHLLTHLDLAAQPARLGEAKRQIQHVVLVVVGLGELVVVVLVRHDDVAGAAGAGPAAGAFHFEVVGLGDVEQVVAVGDLEGVGLAFFVDEGYFAPVGGCGVSHWGLSKSGVRAALTLRRAWGELDGRGGGRRWWRRLGAEMAKGAIVRVSSSSIVVM